MRMLRIAMSLAFGFALLAGTQAWAADGTGSSDEYGTDSSGGTGGAGSTSDYGAGSSMGSTGKEMSKDLGKQASIASRLALYDREASAMADMAIERSQDPKVLQYARDVKSAHERNLSALQSWADQKKAEIAAISIQVPRQGAGGTGMTAEEKKVFDETAAKFGAEFRKEAEEAQANVDKLSQVPAADFDKKFLSEVRDVHEDQIDLAKDAKGKYSADTAFSGAVASTESTFMQLNSQAKSLESSLKK